MQNKLFYGDNLDILREYIPDESVDLIYLDPPFNSKRTYNVLFKHESGEDSEAQMAAFGDTWHWDMKAAATYHDLILNAPDAVGKMIESLYGFIGTNQMMAYLVMMTSRLIELHRVLKPTGSLYLHCDPTASHYLKIVLDAIFNSRNFLNEIIWKRTSSHKAKKWGAVHDVIFLYTKSGQYAWNNARQDHDRKYVSSKYKPDEDGLLYRHDNLTAAGVRNGSSGDAWRDYKVREKGLHWKLHREKLLELVGEKRYRTMTSQEKLDVLDENGLIYFGKDENSFPQYIRYLSDGQAIQDVIVDIPPLNSQAKERLGYPTQKPVQLLKRIIEASSREGDVVLDPFCGCGTTISAAQELGRTWIGIDITFLATSLIKYRLKDQFPDVAYEVVGEPTTLEAAKHLALQDRFQFEWWALPLVGARPVGAKSGSKKGKKGPDKGIDGIIRFSDDHTGKAKRVIVQVKSGKVQRSTVEQLVGTVTREKAAMGILITLENQTKPMKTEAASAGFYHSPGWNQDYPMIQIMTVEELLDGKQPQMPPTRMTFQQAPKVNKGQNQQIDLDI